MFFKCKILAQLVKDKIRYFQSKVLPSEIHNFNQYTSGGDDYCPLKNAEALGGMINNNPAHGFIFGWKDATDKIAAPGEKRIYSVDAEGKVVAALHLKNDGTINAAGSKLMINVSGAATINATSINLGGESGAFVLTENSEIKDGEGRICTITSKTTKTKAV